MTIRNRKGFTLIELIVVIAIIGILAGISIPLYSYYVKSSTERMLREKAETYAVFAENFNRDINLDLMTYEDKAKLKEFNGSNHEAVNLGVMQVYNSPSYGGANSQVKAILTKDDEWEDMAIDESNYGVYLRLSYGTKVNIVSIYIMDEKMKVTHEIK